jgi:hypothetical protein
MNVHFLCLPKENEPKERAARHLAFGCPALLAKSGRLGKSLSLRRVVFPLFALLLGCVIWQLQKTSFLL